MIEATDKVITLLEDYQNNKIELLDLARELDLTRGQADYLVEVMGYRRTPPKPLDVEGIESALQALKSGKMTELEASRRIESITVMYNRAHRHLNRLRTLHEPKNADEVAEKYRRGEILHVTQAARELGCSENRAISLLMRRKVFRTRKETEELIQSQFTSPEVRKIISEISAIINSNHNVIGGSIG